MTAYVTRKRPYHWYFHCYIVIIVSFRPISGHWSLSNPMETSENGRFFDVFRGYIERGLRHKIS